MPGVHFSTLARMAVSPLAYRHAVDHERKDTAALANGRLVHALVLTPELADVAVWRGKMKRGDAWREFQAEVNGKLIATPAELAAAERMRDAVYANPRARALLREGHSEVTVTWDEWLVIPSTCEGGEMHEYQPCRARLDHWSSAGLVELKTSRVTTTHAWAREVAKRAYHVQLAHYRSGIQEAAGVNVGAVHWIVVENVPPYDVAVYRVPHEQIDVGDRLRMTWLRRVAECEASGRWPGVGGDGDEALEFRLPEFAQTEGLPEVDMSGMEEASDDAAEE